MPEGDTLHRAAAMLQAAIVGSPLATVHVPRLPRPAPPTGSTILRVEARGKHLLAFFDDGQVLHTHLRMSGAWHGYRPGDRWHRPARSARAVLGHDGATAVCFDAPVVELLDAQRIDRHPDLRRLGPDLCRADVDLDDATGRMGRFAVAGQTLAEVLLDQRIAAGIGNVYASEACFVAGLHPATPIEAVPVIERRAVLTAAAELLQANVVRAVRTTVPDAARGTLWVYGRAGRPCRRCRSLIDLARLGRGARPTFWCPNCQRPDLASVSGYGAARVTGRGG